MESIIEGLIEIESRAQEAARKADEERAALEGRIARETCRLRAEMEREYGERAAAYAEGLRRDTEAKTADIERDTRRRAERMRAHCGQSRQSWARDIFASVTGGAGR